MAAGNGSSGGVGDDLYAILGLKKECTDAELKVAYRKLAMRWHPDRCSSSGDSKRVEEAKAKFQQIQGAYSVLSDSNKRFLYDVGVYNSDDDESDMQGMGDFLGEMAELMSKCKTWPDSGNSQDGFEDLQQLFVEMFHADLDAGFMGPQMVNSGPGKAFAASSSPSPSPTLPGMQYCNGGNNKRGNSAMTGSGKSSMSDFSSAGLCLKGDSIEATGKRQKQ